MKLSTLSSLFVLMSVVSLIAIAPSAFAAHHEVTIENAPGSSTPGCEPDCFIPTTATVEVGAIVTWSNTDNAAHTATAGSAADGPSGVFDSSLIMAGGSYSFTFDTAGTYPYFCMVHPWMEGTVIVGGASTPADTVPPTVLVPDDITLQTEDQNGASATFNPQAIDNIDELITPTCSPASGSVFAIGTTEVVCTATDSSGNTDSNSFNVIIEYTGSLIPEWVKDVAGFWANDTIDDDTFVNAITYLIQQGLIQV